MTIEHIFNAVKSKPENNKSIISQEFKIEYWKGSKEGYSPPENNIRLF